MKKIFSTNFSPEAFNLATLILRLTAGGFMLTHGVPKLQRLLSGEFQFGDPIGLGPEVSLILAVFAEFLCSVLLILGLGTRLATIPLMVTMAVAAFVAHGADPFGRKELALFYLATYFVIFLLGGGKYSTDHLIFKK